MSAENGTLHTEHANTGQQNRLDTLSGTAALAAGIIFLIPVVAFILNGLQPASRTGPLSSIQNNWLVIIFKLLAGLDQGLSNALYGWNLLDFAILALVGATATGLYAALEGTTKPWSMIALALPFLGIVLFAATKIAGRSAVMASVLIFSILMLRSQPFNTWTASIGILAGVLLLAGDFGASAAPSIFLATLTGVGYLLLTAWFFLVAGGLFEQAKKFNR
jgi:hypothetical protein